MSSIVTHLSSHYKEWQLYLNALFSKYLFQSSLLPSSLTQVLADWDIPLLVLGFVSILTIFFIVVLFRLFFLSIFSVSFKSSNRLTFALVGPSQVGKTTFFSHLVYGHAPVHPCVVSMESNQGEIHNAHQIVTWWDIPGHPSVVRTCFEQSWWLKLRPDILILMLEMPCPMASFQALLELNIRLFQSKPCWNIPMVLLLNKVDRQQKPWTRSQVHSLLQQAFHACFESSTPDQRSILHKLKPKLDHLHVIRISALTGQGFEDLHAWITSKIKSYSALNAVEQKKK